jgi:hypothetical protein
VSGRAIDGLVEEKSCHHCRRRESKKKSTIYFIL